MIAMSELTTASCFDCAVWFEEHSADSRRCLPVISGLADCILHHLDCALHEFARTELRRLRVRLHFQCLLSRAGAILFIRIAAVSLLIIVVISIVLLVILLLIVTMLMVVLLQRTPSSALQ